MFKRPMSWVVIITFVFSLLGPYKPACADVLNLPAPGLMVNVSPHFSPALVKGLIVHKDNPFLFDFIVDPGQDYKGVIARSEATKQSFKDQSDRMIKYFFAALTVPDKDVWVNLSPYEKNRMVPFSLGQTAMGRDLLAQDYLLKQLTASLIYPQNSLGKSFWQTVYAKAKDMYGTTQVPVNTFNKVWIVPQRAGVYEHGQTAYIVDSHLKVMLEEDYLATTKHNAIMSFPNALIRNPNTTNQLGSQIIRQIVLPQIEKEVNEGKNFATLRQIFYAQVLAVWFKHNLKQALLNQVYANKGTVKGIDQNTTATNEAIYQQYLKAYKKGVFNFIKEEPIDSVIARSEATKQSLYGNPEATVARKYFSGGYSGEDVNRAMVAVKLSAQDERSQSAEARNAVDVEAALLTNRKQAVTLAQNIKTADAAMAGNQVQSDTVSESSYIKIALAHINQLIDTDLPRAKELVGRSEYVEIYIRMLKEWQQLIRTFQGRQDKLSIDDKFKMLDELNDIYYRSPLGNRGGAFEWSFPERLARYGLDAYYLIKQEIDGLEKAFYKTNVGMRAAATDDVQRASRIATELSVDFSLDNEQELAVQEFLLDHKSFKEVMLDLNGARTVLLRARLEQSKLVSEKALIAVALAAAWVAANHNFSRMVRDAVMLYLLGSDFERSLSIIYNNRSSEEGALIREQAGAVFDELMEDAAMTVGHLVELLNGSLAHKGALESQVVDIAEEKKARLNVQYVQDHRREFAQGILALAGAYRNLYGRELHNGVSYIEVSGLPDFNLGKRNFTLLGLVGKLLGYWDGTMVKEHHLLISRLNMNNVTRDAAMTAEQVAQRLSRLLISSNGHFEHGQKIVETRVTRENGSLVIDKDFRRRDVDGHFRTVVSIPIGENGLGLLERFKNVLTAVGVKPYENSQEEIDFIEFDAMEHPFQSTPIDSDWVRVPNTLEEDILIKDPQNLKLLLQHYKLSSGGVQEAAKMSDLFRPKRINATSVAESIKWGVGDIYILTSRGTIMRIKAGTPLYYYLHNSEVHRYQDMRQQTVDDLISMGVESVKERLSKLLEDRPGILASQALRNKIRNPDYYITDEFKRILRRKGLMSDDGTIPDIVKEVVGWDITMPLKSPFADADKAQISVTKGTPLGGIDLSEQDAALRVTKDASGGVQVHVDPALIARVEREGISEAIPVIINMRPADLQAVFQA